MSTTATINVRDRVQDLNRCIREGRIIDAINEFYDKDVKMQENANQPTIGLAANIERENQFLSSVKEWKGSEVKAIAVDRDTSFVEWVFDWVAIDGTPVHLEQVAVAKWRNGKIAHERYYYDPSVLPKPEARTA